MFLCWPKIHKLNGFAYWPNTLKSNPIKSNPIKFLLKLNLYYFYPNDNCCIVSSLLYFKLTPNMGKKEFSNFVKCINTHVNSNKIQLDLSTQHSLKTLIEKWKDDNNINKFVYLDNIDDYNNVTDFVRKIGIKNMKEILTLWFEHIIKITNNVMDEEKTKRNLELIIAHYEFKMKISEKYEEMFQNEKEMLDFYRKVAVTGMLTGNKVYTEKPLIDKLLLNCRVSPYSKIQCENIEVRPSEIHGDGVFATENILTGTIVTFYPVDGYNDNNTVDYNVSDDWVNENCETMENYSCTVTDSLKIVGNKSKITNKALLGHMINDSVGNTYHGTTTHDLQNGIYEYCFKSDNNCKLKINEKYGLVYVVTTKNIKKDSELTFSYGPIYWYSRFDSNIQHFIDVCNESKMCRLIGTTIG